MPACSTKFLITNMLNDRISIQKDLNKNKKHNKKEKITTDRQRTIRVSFQLHANIFFRSRENR